MSEERMVEIAEKALVDLGVPETVEAAGQFLPRGHTGSMFAGGFLGDGLTDMAGGLVNSAATVGGAPGAVLDIHDAASGLPDQMLVGVTSTHVCGWAQAAPQHRRRRAGVPDPPPRPRGQRCTSASTSGSLELIETSSGARIELEGNRIPLTHSKDVIQALAH